jgi:phosphopantothenoylcysteine decarboxylase/phosphopantothenate--cysteine ligase
MTRAARHFVGSLTFETLSGHEVIADLFPRHRVVKTRHISVAEWAECILICPATANIIGKVASGIADDFLTTAVMASRCPVIFAPAMDYQMVSNPIYLSNCKKLKDLGYRFIATEEGKLASGAEGQGRLADYGRILDGVKSALFGSDSLKNIKVLVTAGPTREALDPVRYLTNHSSGKMGYALAEEAVLRGAEVILVSGPSEIQPVGNINLIKVESADEMAKAVKKAWKNCDVLLMAAAVADYRPVERSSQKIKKAKGGWSLQLEKTEDIVSDVSKKKDGKIVVGFALETEDGEKRAKKKLVDKRLDLICLNNPLEEGAGFGGDTNRITLIDHEGRSESLPLMPKWEVAGKILDRVESLMEKDKKG